MLIAFYITLLYAISGFFYFPNWYSFTALVYILISTSPLLIAGFFSNDRNIKEYKPVNRVLFWTILAIGTLNLAIIARNTGFHFADIFSAKQIVAIASRSATIRYEIDTQSHSGNPVLLALSLWLVFRTGTVEKQTRILFKILPFIPILMYTILTTEKWPAFLSIVFYCTGIAAANQHVGALKRYVNQSKYVLAFGGLMLLSLFLRNFSGSVKEAVNVLFHYNLAQYTSLGHWIVHESFHQGYTFGKYSFIGPLSYFSDVERNAGIYLQSFVVYGKQSNIYTAFRYLIQDFSLLGPLILNALIASLYLVCRYVKYDTVARAIRIFVVFSALLSLNVTPFVHNSVAFGIGLAILSDAFSRPVTFRSLYNQTITFIVRKIELYFMHNARQGLKIN